MIKLGINGLGRIGRLCFRIAWLNQDIEIVCVNDPGADAETLAHLLTFDSSHGRWLHNVKVDGGHLSIGDDVVACTHNSSIGDTDWSDCDLVIEASGKMKRSELLEAYLDQGIRKVVVSAPVADPGILNVVMGVNDHLYEADTHHIVTAASCTTNCLAPAVKVIHESLGIRHGTMTTIHAVTNTQSVLDTGHPDLRRARASGTNLIPTTTGSAKAITRIFPELEGKLNGHAVRVPVVTASLTDCVFEVAQKTSVEEVNALLKSASEGSLKGILGYEERPLVSVDYTTDPRSGIVDALSTMVVDDTQVKLYLWYDNEWGYANRTIELAQLIGSSWANR